MTVRGYLRGHTLSVLDKHLVHIFYFAEAGPPALLGLLSPLRAVGVAPHELVVIQCTIGRALSIAPPAGHNIEAVLSMSMNMILVRLAGCLHVYSCLFCNQ